MQSIRYKLNLTAVISLLVGGFCDLYGQDDSVKTKSYKSRIDSTKSYTTAHVQGEPPKIDGVLNDPAWEQVPWGGGTFRQRDPDAGADPSVQTYFKILYDAKNLYVAFRCVDPEPDKIVERMSRRDGFDGDWVEINIDSYADKRSAFSFTSSVSGVKGDEYVSNNGDNWDASWDPIWYLKTSINNEGWAAELRIPLSQLRFTNKPEHTWGFQIMRNFFRNQERSIFQYIPPTTPGYVHLFAELRGVKGIKPQKQLEIQPYVVTKAETFQKEEGNPFMTGQSSNATVGLDAKIGITSDVTLDLTVNPDFGQVEADPSRVNLTAFELFFQERRPFFIEGNNTLNYPLTDFSTNNLFYSRRIGRSPQGSVETGPNDFVNVKSRTTILGAAKLTGKNKKGFSWGILESVTKPEQAQISNLGVSRYQTVEPMTNYFVSRAQQDINKGNTIIGGMFTATNRKIDNKELDWLRTDAYTGGLDFIHNMKNRKYYLSAKTFMSHVEGSRQAMLETQTSSERYFQRPDNHHVGLDSTRRSLTGTGGAVLIGKRSGRLVYDFGFSWLSPQLELNDIGFLLQTDLIKQWSLLQYRVPNPAGIFRSQYYNFYQSHLWDFGWRNLSMDQEVNWEWQFQNLWGFGGGVAYNEHSVSNADLRGGPALLYPGNIQSWMWASTDRRKKFYINVSPSWLWGNNNYLQNTNLDVTITYRPTNALNISIAPSYSYNRNEMQYVATAAVAGDPRFLVGEINQTTIRVALRMTYMITPNLSIQYWGQPFGTSGAYSNFKYITDASAAEYHNRYTTLPTNSLTLNDTNYQVDENNKGSVDYTFSKPDFNIGQFRSNMVMRWEYIPGSTLFLVWTQEINGAFYDRSNPLQAFDFNQQAHNVFVMKFTYRFVL
ncbi:hypothetical protein WSM22_34970 [Cytophagales bacterium WSM2-2]|nr:hypothetical protein WSM22_34970 [Cytophagales bacterium WSM2-2]